MVELEVKDKKFLATLGNWISALAGVCTESVQSLAFAHACGRVWPDKDVPAKGAGNNNNKRKGDNADSSNKKNKFETSNKDQTDQNNQDKWCGKMHKGKCNLEQHPLSNKEDKPWNESSIGKRLKALGFDDLPVNKKFEGDELVDFKFKVNNSNKPKIKENECSDSDFILSIRAQALLKGRVWRKNKNSLIDDMQICEILIDSGAPFANYINEDLVDYFKKNFIDLEFRDIDKQNVTAAFGNVTVISKIVKFNITIFSDKSSFDLCNEE
jgi:hypothetical protein